MRAPAVIVTLPRAVVPFAMLMAFLSVTCVPMVVALAPPLSTTLLKSLSKLVSVASANGVMVAVPVEIITPAVGCVIDPAVEVRFRVGTVTKLLVADGVGVVAVPRPAMFNVPPLVRETG